MTIRADYCITAPKLSFALVRMKAMGNQDNP